MSLSNRKIIRRNARWLLRPTALVLMLFIFASFDVASQVPSEATFEFKSHSEPVFEFQHKYKKEIVFSLQIYEDGKIIYRGYTYPPDENITQPVIIEHHSEITRQQVNELSKYFLALPFKELKKYEEKSGSVPVFDTIFFKSAYVHIEMINTIFFKAMTKELKKITDIQDWVCLSKSQNNSKQACLEDLPEDFQY